MIFNLNKLELKSVCGVVAVLALVGLASCNSDDDYAELSMAQQESDPAPQAPVYSVSIPAQMGAESGTKALVFDGAGSLSARFDSSDRVYVYNETQQAFACRFDQDKKDYVPCTLSPSDISADGMSCTLTGQLSFYRYDYDAKEWEALTVDGSDTYSLYYNMNCVELENPENSGFDYDTQDGTAQDLQNYDFAEATGVTMTRQGGSLTFSGNGVRFNLLQSIFRQTLTFTDEAGNPITAPEINWLKISTRNNTLIYCYDPLSDNTYYDGFVEGYMDDTSVLYVALSFHYDDYHTAQDDALWVDAYATDGCVYSIRKDAPAGGFSNGKYYHGSMTLKRGGVFCTDNNDCVPLIKENGKYSLEDGKEYLVEGNISGNIEGTGSIVLRIADNSKIRGCVTLKGTSQGPAYIFTGQDVQFYNPPYQALLADSEYLTIIDYSSYINIHGVVSGQIMLDCGSELKMTGDLVDAHLYLAESCWFRIYDNPTYKITNSVITAAFDSEGNENVNITSRFARNNNYKEFYGGEVPDPCDGGDPGDLGDDEGPDEGEEGGDPDDE